MKMIAITNISTLGITCVNIVIFKVIKSRVHKSDIEIQQLYHTTR